MIPMMFFKFSMCSQYVSQGCFQSHLTFIHKVCPIKFSPSPLYGFAKGEAQIFHVKASIVGSFQSFSLHFILF